MNFDDIVKELKRKEEEDPFKSSRGERLRNFMLSAGLGGAGLGAGTSLLADGTKGLAVLGKKALTGGVTSALLAGAAGLTGDLVLGDPKPGETGAFMKRGALGGLLGGAALGGVTGGIIASGRVRNVLSKLPKPVARKLEGLPPKENMIVDKFSKWSGDPNKTRTKLGALLGGSIGAIGSAAVGADEGMQADVIADQAAKLRGRKRKRSPDVDDRTASE